MGGQGPHVDEQRGAVPGRVRTSGGNLDRGHMPAQDVLVIGLGYVGLPLAVQAARAGFRVTGFDTSAEIAAGLNAGRSHVDDVSATEVGDARARRFRVTSDEAEIGPQDVIVICVPTPLSQADGTGLGAVAAPAGGAGRLTLTGPTWARSGPPRRQRDCCCARGRWCRWSRPRTRAPPMKWCGRCWRTRPG